MRIFLVTQQSWNDGEMSDFDLPREIGYYRTWQLAERGRDRDIKHIESKRHANSEDSSISDDFTTMEDYQIREIEVTT